jgi:hypothetical protein
VSLLRVVGVEEAVTLPDRIDEALAGRPLEYYELAAQLWPIRSKAWRTATGGGPPGLVMALSAALRRGKFRMSSEGRTRVVHPRSKSP